MQWHVNVPSRCRMAAAPLTLRWRWARRSNLCKLPNARHLQRRTKNLISTKFSRLISRGTGVVFVLGPSWTISLETYYDFDVAIEIICLGPTLWMFREFLNWPSKPLKRVGFCWGHDGHVRKDIFDFIISKLGSLRRMDKQIRALMAEMLMRNLSNVERATGNLVDSLGPVVTLNEKCFQSHVVSGILQIYSSYSKFCTHCDFVSTHKTVTRPMELTHLSN